MHEWVISTLAKSLSAGPRGWDCKLQEISRPSKRWLWLCGFSGRLMALAQQLTGGNVYPSPDRYRLAVLWWIKGQSQRSQSIHCRGQESGASHSTRTETFNGFSNMNVTLGRVNLINSTVKWIVLPKIMGLFTSSSSFQTHSVFSGMQIWKTILGQFWI